MKYNLYDIGDQIIAEHERSAILAIVKGEILAKNFLEDGKAPHYSIRFFWNNVQHVADFKEDQILGYAYEPR